jgi:hypothetical protein
VLVSSFPAVAAVAAVAAATAAVAPDRLLKYAFQVLCSQAGVRAVLVLLDAVR